MASLQKGIPFFARTPDGVDRGNGRGGSPRVFRPRRGHLQPRFRRGGDRHDLDHHDVGHGRVDVRDGLDRYDRPGLRLVRPNAVIGFIGIDSDQDVSFGDVRTIDWYGPSGLGMEFFVDLKSEKDHAGQVELVNARTLLTTATVPIVSSPSPDPTSFALTLRRAKLGDSGDLFNLGAIVGTYSEPTDRVTGVIPEPTSLLVWGLLFGLALVGGVCRAGEVL